MIVMDKNKDMLMATQLTTFREMSKKEIHPDTVRSFTNILKVETLKTKIIKCKLFN